MSDHTCSFHCVRPDCVEQVRRRDFANRAVMQQALEALDWYQTKAKMMGKAAIHSDSKAMLATMHEIAVDYGKQATAAIAALKEQLK